MTEPRSRDSVVGHDQHIDVVALAKDKGAADCSIITSLSTGNTTSPIRSKALCDTGSSANQITLAVVTNVLGLSLNKTTNRLIAPTPYPPWFKGFSALPDGEGYTSAAGSEHVVHYLKDAITVELGIQDSDTLKWHLS